MTALCAIGDLVGGRYSVEKYLGEGGMQEVYRADDQLLGRRVALKAPKSPSAKKRFKRSAVVSAKVNHVNVAKTLDYVVEDGSDFLIEEFIDGMDLAKFLREWVPVLDPAFAAKVFHHIVKGVAASHHVSVVHRDLKPSNIMVLGGKNAQEFKVTDFGIAKMAEEELAEAVEGGDSSITASQTAIGALPYMAPEMIKSMKSAGTPADVWSLGAMLYELMSGEKPFGVGLQAIPKIVAGEIPPLPRLTGAHNPQFRTGLDDLYELVSECLNIDPTRRPSADELVERCGLLCYADAVREFGTVSHVPNNSWGFIVADQGTDVFFHRESIFNARMLAPGDRVWFARHVGGGNDRAFPILKLN